jgi:PAS domain S-box-containing protein
LTAIVDFLFASFIGYFSILKYLMNLSDSPLLNTIVNSAPIGICILTADGFIAEMVNDKFIEIAGKPKEAVLGKWYWEAFEGTKAEYEHRLSSVVTSKQAYYADEVTLMLLRHNREEWIQVSFVYAPVFDESGEVNKVAVWVLENTSQVLEREKIKAGMKAAERERDRIHEFLNKAPAGIAIVSGSDFTFEFVNPQFQALLPRRNLLGRAYFDALPELIGSEFNEALQRVYRLGDTISFDEQRVPLSPLESGTLEDRYFTFTFMPRYDDQQKVNGIYIFAIEVTQSVQNRSDVENANSELSQIVNMLPASVVVIKGNDLIVEKINDANLTYWKRSREEVTGKRFLDILPELADQPFAGQLRQVMNTGVIIDVKESLVLFTEPNGNTRETYVDYTYQPLFDHQGNIDRVLVMSFEVTDRVLSRRLLEQYAHQLSTVNDNLSISNNKLARSESRFRYLIHEAPVAIGILRGSDFRIESANSKILELWGKTENIIGLTLAEALPEIKDQPFLGLLENVLATGEAFNANEIKAMLEHQGQLKELYFNVVYQPVRDLTGNIADILVVAVDVTPQVTARKQVEQSEAYFKTLADLVPSKISNALPSGEVIFFNKRWTKFAGMGFEDLRDFGYHQMMHPDEIRPFQAGLAEAAAKGIPYVSEMRFKNTEGEYIWHLNIAAPVLDEMGNITMWVGSTTDIQALKEEEQRKNDFIAMVSHELKTPLTSIHGYLQLLKRKAKDNENMIYGKAFDQSLNQVRKMTTLINGFLNVSRLESGSFHMDKSTFDMANLFDELEKEYQVLYSSHILTFNKFEGIIHADREKIAQVINNLVGNAVKYSATGSLIEVSSEQENGKLRVCVKDNGMGIKADAIPRLFERYYRVEQTSNIAGFGIGLYLSSEIIKAHGGTIWAESEFGRGSRFCFELPQ